MHTNHGPKEDPLTDLGYEPRDVNVAQLGKWVIGFFIFVVLSLITSWVILSSGIHFWFIQIDGMSPAYTGKADDFKSRKIPGAPNPLLQNNVTARSDIMDMRRAEDERLKGYGWANALAPKVSVASTPSKYAREMRTIICFQKSGLSLLPVGLPWRNIA